MSIGSDDMNIEKKNNTISLGENYQPIIANYYNIRSFLNLSYNSVNNKNKKKINFISYSNNKLKAKRSLEEKIHKNISRTSQMNESHLKNYNNSYNLSRGENTTLSTIDNKSSINNEEEQKIKIANSKDSMICYFCKKNVFLQRFCSKCRKIVCEECMKKWFLVESNYKCFNCKNNIDNISNISSRKNEKNIINYSNIELNSNNTIDIKDYKNKNKKAIINEKLSHSTRNKSYTHRNIGTSINKEKKFFNRFNILKKLKSKQINKISYINKLNQEIFNPVYCKIHSDQLLSYYCINCQRFYCRTCFISLEQEKNSHKGHKIIDCENFKNNNNDDLLNNNKNLKEKCKEINNMIKKCEDLKKCYFCEKEIVNKYIKFIIKKYNEKMEQNIHKINELIIKYKKYIDIIKNIQKDIEKYNLLKLIEKKSNFYEVHILINLTKVKNLEYQKSIDIYANLSPKFIFNIYQSELKQFNIVDMNFRYEIGLDDSKYNLVALKKKTEIQIYIYYPIEKKIKNRKIILPFVYIRRNENNWELFELKEYITYKSNNYFIKRFNANSFCENNSFFKIKGILYESSFL